MKNRKGTTEEERKGARKLEGMRTGVRLQRGRPSEGVEVRTLYIWKMGVGTQLPSAGMPSASLLVSGTTRDSE